MEMLAYHGSLTDQFRNTAAKPSIMTSVTIELPFLKNIPPIAGRSAKARGAECQCDAGEEPWIPSLGFGRSKSSVEERNCRRASLIEYSEKLEDRLLMPMGEFSALLPVDSLLVGRDRNWADSSPPSVWTRLSPDVGVGDAADVRRGILFDELPSSVIIEVVNDEAFVYMGLLGWEMARMEFVLRDLGLGYTAPRDKLRTMTISDRLDKDRDIDGGVSSFWLIEVQ